MPADPPRPACDEVVERIAKAMFDSLFGDTHNTQWEFLAGPYNVDEVTKDRYRQFARIALADQEARLAQAERELDTARSYADLLLAEKTAAERERDQERAAREEVERAAKLAAEQAGYFERLAGERLEALRPFGAVAAEVGKGSDDACWCGQNGAVIRYKHLRRAAALTSAAQSPSGGEVT